MLTFGAKPIANLPPSGPLWGWNWKKTMSESRKYRLITRSDMDGLVCATLIRHLGLADEILFAHPKDMQDRKIAVGPNDIITNLPYAPGAHLCIDHHLSETLRSPKRCDHVIDPQAPSAARVVFNHFGGFQRFPKSFEAMMAAVDRADSGSFTLEEVLHPREWALLSFIMDGRTGLGRFKDFRISHDQLMRDLIGYCGRLSIEEIMQLPDVRERVETYFSYEALFKAQLQDHARVDKNLVLLDLRKVDPIYPGNRFLLYALYPQCNISIRAINGPLAGKTVFAVGKSIFNRTAKTNVGALMLAHGGGGHEAVGTCQVDDGRAEDVLQELTAVITRDG
jgi:nanoRNase/pAp phosphatase (c-di-AMP/oligoRNAs hydrolase)